VFFAENKHSRFVKEFGFDDLMKGEWLVFIGGLSSGTTHHFVPVNVPRFPHRPRKDKAQRDYKTFKLETRLSSLFEE